MKDSGIKRLKTREEAVNGFYADAVTGYTEDGRPIFGYDRMVSLLTDRKGMGRKEAREFISREFNC